MTKHVGVYIIQRDTVVICICALVGWNKNINNHIINIIIINIIKP